MPRKRIQIYTSICALTKVWVSVMKALIGWKCVILEEALVT